MKEKKNAWLFMLMIFLLCSNASFSQEKYWVYFTDKDTTGFNPYTFFDGKAIARRQERGISLFNISDMPVSKKYINALSGKISEMGFQSRWLNAVSVVATKHQILEIRRMPFVRQVKKMGYLEFEMSEDELSDSLDLNDQFIYEKQIDLLQGNEFIKHGINGKGIRIAIFDGGFSGVNQSVVFKHLFDHGQIIKTYDFRGKKDFVYAYMTHGSKVLSCIAGMYKDRPMGLATEAEFLLARTEIKPERHVEEEYWLAAVEWADRNGADIISSSLGYTAKLYPIEAMDGKTSIVAKAAELAASKGMLVINAMGNDGNDKWEVMGTPADADSVLSVGGINPYTGFHIFFSSYGPTKDMRMKPNVCAPAVAITANRNSVEKAYGTSFSTPLVSGFAACVWQMNRKKTNMEIFHLIEQSAHLYPYFDYAHGYGIPQASFFFEKKDSVSKPDPFELTVKDDSLRVIVTDLDVKMADPFDYVYFHIENRKGILRYYSVIKVSKPDVLQLNINDLESGEKVGIYYKKCVKEYVKK